jgi:PAS domain S-box-containing protein
MDIMLKNDLVSASNTGGYGEVYFLSQDLEGNMEIFNEIVHKFEKSQKLKDFTSSPEFFERVMKQTDDAVIITNSEWQIFFWNKSAEVLLGYNEKEVLGDDLDIFPDMEVRNELQAKVQEGEQVMGFETKLKQKSEELIDVSITMDPIKDENEKIIGYSLVSRDETERKKAKEALHVSEEKYRAAFNTSPDISYRVDPDGKIMDCNDAAREILGYSKEELIGKPILDLYTVESRVQAKEYFEEWKRSGRLRNKELKIITKDGRKIDVSLNVNTIYDKSGNVISSISSQRDITKHKEMDKALRESERQYRELVDNSLVGIFKSNLAGDILYVNNALLKIMDFDNREELISQKAIMHYRDPKDRDQLIRELKKKSRVSNYGIRIRTKKGDVKNVIISASLAGETIEGMVMDITQQRLIKEDLHLHQTELEAQNAELREAQEALEESRSIYSDLYDFAPVGYFTLDPKGLIKDVNLTGADLLGWKRRHLTKKPMDQLIATEDRDKFRMHLREVFKEGAKQSCDVKFFRKDKSMLSARLISKAVEDEKGNRVACRTMVIDL